MTETQDGLSRRIVEGVTDADFRSRKRAVAELRFNVQDGLGAVFARPEGIDELTERSYADRGSAVQANVPVDARPLVEPALLERSIYPDTEQVILAEAQILGNIVDLRGIAASLAAEVETVEKNAAIAEDSVKL